MEKYNEVNEQLLLWGRLAGLKSIYSDEPERPFLAFVAIIQHFHVLFTVIDTIYYSLQFFNKEDLIKLVVNFMIIWLITAGSGMYVVMRLGLKDFAKETQVLKELHCTNIPGLKGIHNRHFAAGYKNCHILNHFARGMAVFSVISFVTFGTGFAYLSNKDPYPLPFFREICFCPITGPLSYAINMIAMSLQCATVTIYFIVMGTYLFYAASLTIAKLEVAIEVVHKVETISDNLSYDEWVKIVMDSITTSKDILVFLRERYSILCYLEHKCSYVSLFVSFVIFKIDPRQMGAACGGLTIVFGFLIFVLLNEHFQDKFDELNDALYDLKWYEMKPKDRKPLIILIQCSLRPISLTAGGIHDLSLEWFGGMLNASYSAALVLEDLIAMHGG